MAGPEDLLFMFQSMGTTDHDTLVQHFMQVVSSEDPDSCRFFLEANNWNIQNAIASYYDAGSTEAIEQQRHPPEMQLVGDVTIDNKEYIFPNTPFRQTWRLKNAGLYEAWPASTALVHVQGDRIPGPAVVQVPPLEPGQEYDVTIPLKCPSKPGSYAAAYRLCVNDGYQMFFGEQMWIVLNVVEPGLDQSALDEVERQRLQLESQHQLDALIGSFSHMQSDNQEPNRGLAGNIFGAAAAHAPSYASGGDSTMDS